MKEKIVKLPEILPQYPGYELGEINLDSMEVRYKEKRKPGEIERGGKYYCIIDTGIVFESHDSRHTIANLRHCHGNWFPSRSAAEQVRDQEKALFKLNRLMQDLNPEGWKAGPNSEKWGIQSDLCGHLNPFDFNDGRSRSRYPLPCAFHSEEAAQEACDLLTEDEVQALLPFIDFFRGNA